MKKLKTSTRYWTLSACALVGGAMCASVARAEIAMETATTNAPKATATPKVAKTKAVKPKTTRVRGTANVRILHAIKGAPAVDVYVDDKKVLTAADYKSVSDYVAMSSGKRAVKVTLTGKNEAIFSGDISLTKDKFFTLAVYGTPAKPLLLRVNETTGKMYNGKTRVFVTHLAQAPAVDITTASTRNKTTGYATFVKTLEPGKTRAKTVSAGDATLQVRSGGAVLKDASAKLESGKRYAVFAVGSVDAIELVVKPAAPAYVEAIVAPKPKKVATPKASAKASSAPTS